jgi:ROS/MUCR transcriptional regulator protein
MIEPNSTPGVKQSQPLRRNKTQGPPNRAGRRPGSKNRNKKYNANRGTSRFSSGASWMAEVHAWWRDQTQFRTYDELRIVLGCSYPTVKNLMAGRTFPIDALCDKLYELTNLECFGVGRERARCEHRGGISQVVRGERRTYGRARYSTNAEEILAQQKEKYDAERQFVPEGPERDALRADPRIRKNVCRECGEILVDVGPHLWATHKMQIAEYKEKWGFLRSRNATRSESTQQKQRDAMKRKGIRPPRWTRKFLPEAIKASTRTNRPGTARLEERLNARDRTRGGKHFHARPQEQRRGGKQVVADARIAKLHLRGKSLKEIASASGRSMSAVSLRLKRMGYEGRNHAFFHGDEVGPRHFRDYCSDFALTVPLAAADLKIGVDWAYARMNSKHANKPFSFDLGSRLVKAREKRTASFRFRPVSKKGGRPSSLPPSERASLREKYPALMQELRAVRVRPPNVGLWTWLCDEFRVRRLPLLKRWPAFFGWAEKNLQSAVWKPGDLARQFLAAEYGVSEDTVSGIVFRKPQVS